MCQHHAVALAEPSNLKQSLQWKPMDAYLNDIEGLENPTIEKMAEWFWKKTGIAMPRTLRDCRARNINRALRLSRRIV
jgi:hypothetical protein